MAKKNKNTLLYAGLGMAAALLLFKKKDSGLNGIGKLPYEKNRKQAAEALHELAKNYENISYSTVYKNCFYSPRLKCWRYIGQAHDYSY